jgi:FKBP-type peptidyl-prolyl cis-trans isomerase
VQEGLEKDGSPKYRYFKTQGEYEDYMSGKKGKDAKSRKKDKAEVSGKAEESGSTRLDKMREKEQKESNRKKRALFSENKKKKQEVETTKKGLRLYIEVEE